MIFALGFLARALGSPGWHKYDVYGLGGHYCNSFENEARENVVLARGESMKVPNNRMTSEANQEKRGVMSIS